VADQPCAIGPRIWVVGSASIDQMVRLPSLPRPGEAVTGGVMTSGLGGKGANHAVAAARIGGSVAFVGAVGDDEGGRLARSELEAAGIDVTCLAISSHPTARALGMIDASSGQNMWGVDSGANFDIGAEAVIRALRDAGPADIVTAVNEIPAHAVLAAARAAKAAGCRFVFNAAPGRLMQQELASLCDVIIVNEAEIYQLGFGGQDDLLAAGAQTVVVTLGPAGAEAYERSGLVDRAPALDVEVIDTTGAGDAFVGAYVVALGEGMLPSAALRWGTAAGSLACRAMGPRASLPDRKELAARVQGG
jgi:ribokinase